ncbi:MAG TPA: ATP-dependent zinc metalloprotease FtsH [Candidatus Kapabacteria bacterium]|nr:ATP-dependent zinc metalloprotease FtsH [Candidatus Kapabacteria bacterium]
MKNQFAFADRSGQDPDERPTSRGGGSGRPSGDRGGRFSPSPNKQGGDMNNRQHMIRTVLLWVVMIAGASLVMYIARGTGDADEVEVSNTYYQQLLADGKFASATIEQYDQNAYRFHGVFKQQETVIKDNSTTPTAHTKKIVTNLIPETLADQYKLWNEKGIQIRKVDNKGTWMDGLIAILPWVISFYIVFLILRRMQNQGLNGPKGLFSFGKSRARFADEKAPRVTFADVAGADEAKTELQEIIEFLKEPQKFQRLGGKIPRGVLLLGPPGTGKTLLARAVAGEAGVPFLSISGADFVEMFVGVGASRVRDLFDQAKRNAPCIVFIDEIDAVGRHRGAGLGGGHDEREQTLNQLLVEMDGFEQNSGVIIMAATNRPDVLDPALLRPGRFDRQVIIDRPDVRGREGILKVHTRKVPLSTNVDLNILAKGTPGFSGADLANLVNEAALLAARHNGDRVGMPDFEDAKDKVMMGLERKSAVISEEEKKITAYHESGHVIVARKMPESDPVHKVTIIPRGRALGVTSYLPIDEKHTYSREYLESMIAYALGGRAAEKLIFNRITTGAGNDIERATDLARKMVCDWGMSDKLGPLKYGRGEHEVFLGRDMSSEKTYSDTTGRIIDEEIRRIVEEGMTHAENILRDQVGILHKMAAELLVRETLTGAQVEILMAGGELAPYERPELEKMPEKKYTIADNVKVPPLGDIGGIAPMPA